MAHTDAPSPAELASQVIARTALAWQVTPQSARAIARRAPHGYVPVRALRRLRAAAALAGQQAAAGGNLCAP